MRIVGVEAFALRFDHHYKVAGRDHQPNRLPGTPYYFEPAWRQVYSTQLMTCLIKITTNTGLVGWGEAQAPIAPEVVVAIVRGLIGPALLDQNPLAHLDIHERLTHMMDIRGHREGYLNDAIAGVDIALWDIKGKSAGLPITALLGGNPHHSTPLYVSGLRMPTLDEQTELATKHISDGYAGIKLFVSGTPTEAATQIERIRNAIGDHSRLMIDLLWGYSLTDTLALAPTLEANSVDFLEAPLPLDNIDDHARLAAATRVPLAIGEHIHSAPEFRTWIERAHPRVLQPDVARTGITEALRIANTAQTHGCHIAWHVGTCSPLAMAATWHLAAATPSPYLLEHQTDLLPTVNNLTHPPLSIDAGEGQLPPGPGLGLDIDQPALHAHTTQACDIHP